MSLTLEMPATDLADNFTPGPVVDHVPADEAANLLDSPGGDDAQADEPQQPAADSPVATEHEQPEKKKRGRKKKQPEAKQQAETTPAGPEGAGDIPPSDAPPAESEPGTNPEPSKQLPEGGSLNNYIAKQETSTATRAFQIAKVKADYIEVCLEIQEAEELIERTKTQVKHLTEIQANLSIELRSMRNDEMYQPRLPMGDASATPAVAATESATMVDSPAAAAPPSDLNPDAWRTVSITELGLSPKLVEKLDEAGASNMGQLENLRAEISQGKAKWPKGIGQAKITDIENKVVEWLTKNRDAGTFAGLDQVVQPGTTTTTTVVVPATAPATIDASTIPDFDTWDALTDSQQQDYACARAVILDTGEENALSTQHPDGSKCWDSGYEAYGRGLKVSECPYIPGANMDDWLRGWLGHGKVDAYEPPAPGDAIVEREGPAAPVLAELDDL